MTIFQKMMVIPLLSFFLYTGLIVIGVNQYSNNNHKTDAISENYLAALELINENTQLYNQAVATFKDAVLAGESDWVMNSQDIKQQFNQNINLLKALATTDDMALIEQLQNSFNGYYANALKLSLALLQDRNFSSHDQLILSVEQYSSSTAEQLKGIKLQWKQGFITSIESSKNQINKLLISGSVAALVLLILMVALMTYLSITTRQSFTQIIARMKEFAQGKPDYSQRLQHRHKDELGYLIHWFNKLSDKLEQDHRQIEQLSLTDKLTQLSNRTHTDAYLKKLLSEQESHRHEVVLMIGDIDHFKSINDRFGHLSGDQVLREFAQILKQQTRSQDFVGRWGGEEFIIVMPDVGVEQARKNAERLRQAIERHDFGEAGRVTASFGLAIRQLGETQDSLIHRADQGLYRAKQQGRNQVILFAG